ncbi:ABC transporter substrate-binding protein [Siminovitchia terrae]|uniref:ABC transporter substrate-binding protein n=2 Tax=Siminovitchia terrae TaxID=1914933 RepID=A0A429XAA5_SIMTE|nr:ABC transporter substrate-binding protein [Siminovitchia terrae]
MKQNKIYIKGDKSMKKALGSLLLAGSLVLAGCGNDAKPEKSDNGGGEEPNKLVVTSFGGDYEKAQMEYLIKPFEKEFNAEVEVVTLYSADALAKLRAQKNAPEIDVVQFSGGQEIQAAKEDLILEIDSDIVKNTGELYDNAKKTNYGPAIAFDALGLLYNTELVKEAPTSWEDLWKKEYKGKVGLVDISNTYGLQFLAMMAKLHGGDEENIDPGFEKIKTLLPNTASVVATTPDMGNLFAQEEVVIAPYDAGYAFNFSKQGQPIGFVIPDEGAMAVFINMQVVKGTESPKLAQEFVNYSLRPEVQKAFAEETGFAPTNKNVEISEELAKVMPYGEEAVNSLVDLNWEVANNNKDDWTDRWNKMISQ